jgi:hypothetical protein
MIPKIIHYCWFGGKEMPKSVTDCIDSWKKYMPDHTLMLWNESNSPMDHPYVKATYENRKWANVSNYVRLFALVQHGGWYFDTDVEVMATPKLDQYPETCFLGLESKPQDIKFMVNNAIIATEANHPFIKGCYENIQTFDGKEIASVTSPLLTTQQLMKIGFKGKPGVFENVRVFPHDVFYPTAWYEKVSPSLFTKDTLCVHHCDASWLTATDFSDEEFKLVCKEHGYYKNGYHRLVSGQMTWKEFLTISFNFKKRKLMGLFGIKR